MRTILNSPSKRLSDRFLHLWTYIFRGFLEIMGKKAEDNAYSMDNMACKA